MLVLLTPDGPVHSFGSWAQSGETLTMTHNDFPLDASGVSKEAVTLEILELGANRFTTQNAKGDVRERVRCSAIEIKSGPDHKPH